MRFHPFGRYGIILRCICINLQFDMRYMEWMERHCRLCLPLRNSNQMLMTTKDIARACLQLTRISECHLLGREVTNSRDRAYVGWHLTCRTHSRNAGLLYRLLRNDGSRWSLNLTGSIILENFQPPEAWDRIACYAPSFWCSLTEFLEKVTFSGVERYLNLRRDQCAPQPWATSKSLGTFLKRRPVPYLRFHNPSNGLFDFWSIPVDIIVTIVWRTVDQSSVISHQPSAISHKFRKSCHTCITCCGRVREIVVINFTAPPIRKRVRKLE
jgi:hypothetical protein